FGTLDAVFLDEASGGGIIHGQRRLGGGCRRQEDARQVRARTGESLHGFPSTSLHSWFPRPLCRQRESMVKMGPIHVQEPACRRLGRHRPESWRGGSPASRLL